MYNDPDSGGRLRHDTREPDSWGAEMLVYLRDHDLHYERWRHEQLARYDEEYRLYKQERYEGGFVRWRLEREQRAEVERQQRTGRIDEPAEPVIAMPLSAADMPPGGATIAPDADAPRHKAQLREYHAEAAPAWAHDR